MQSTDMGSAGSRRVMELAAQRDAERREIEKQRAAEAAKTAAKIASVSQIGSKFQAQTLTGQERLSASTVGLVSAEHFRRAREELEAEQAMAADRKLKDEELRARGLGSLADGPSGQRKAQAVKTKKNLLSFGDDEDGEPGDGASSLAGEEDPPAAKKIRKNPEVDTSFLPDAERDAAEEAERRRLKEIWLDEQRRLKEEDLHIVYSYWDGTGHRKEITVKKGNTVDEFLRKALVDLSQEFKELRHATPDMLIYVKEDVILGGHFSFYDFIVSKARGKSGPLFTFDVREDVRLLADATVEKSESHAGKVMERRFYEKNKNFFPYNRYEIFDPTKKYDKFTQS
jgi:protein FAM50